MLLGLNTRRANRLLTEVQETANARPEFCKLLISGNGNGGSF
jgi:hypothetical protein